MNTENVSNEAETPALNKGAVSGSLSFDEAVTAFMLFDRIKYTYFRELNCH